jgi:Cu/Ag efflux pump CusA
MAPTALGLGDGGEENAPLGRAVIGGLIFATCATLMFVPVVFSIFHARPKHETKHEPRHEPKTAPLPSLGEPHAA